MLIATSLLMIANDADHLPRATHVFSIVKSADISKKCDIRADGKRLICRPSTLTQKDVSAKIAKVQKNGRPFFGINGGGCAEFICLDADNSGASIYRHRSDNVYTNYNIRAEQDYILSNIVKLFYNFDNGEVSCAGLLIRDRGWVLLDKVDTKEKTTPACTRIFALLGAM